MGLLGLVVENHGFAGDIFASQSGGFLITFLQLRPLPAPHTVMFFFWSSICHVVNLFANELCKGRDVKPQ